MDSVSIGILTGGKSSRMGANKAFLKYDDEKNFLQHAIATAFECSDDVLVSVDDEGKYLNLVKGLKKGLRLVEDKKKGYGPLEGIYQILKEMNGDKCFIFAVDMPLVNEAFIKNLFSYNKEECDLCFLANGDIKEMTCAIYSKSLLPIIEEMFEEDLHKLGALISNKKVKAKELDVKELGLGEEVFKNVNTPEDYKNIKKLLTCE